MHQYKSIKRQQGVVIVIALFFVALIAVMAYLMMSRLERDTHRTSLILRDVQAELYAQGSIDWAKEQLRNNLSNQKPNIPVDKMPIQSPKNEMNGFTIESKITDMQSRLNLNNMTTPEAQTDFKRLLHIVDTNISEDKAQEITLALADWISPGQQQNEYNKYYMSLPTPYRAAHKPMVSASELLLIRGMTPALYANLQPYVTALPVPTFVNVQTAPAQVLATLTPDMSVESGKALEKIRTQTPIGSTDIFLNLDLVKNHKVPKEKITVVSNYFLVETTVAIEKLHIVLYTLIERTGTESKNAVSIIWQSKSVPG